VRLGKVEKFNPRYIRSYSIIQRIGEVAYRLELPAELQRIHNVFHVSQLRKYIPDPSHVIEPDPIQLQENLSYEEQPLQILDRWEKQLRKKAVPLVKVLRANHKSFEATWELEQEMQGKYPHLFPSGMYQFRGRNLLSGVACKTSGIKGVLVVCRSIMKFRGRNFS